MAQIKDFDPNRWISSDQGPLPPGAHAGAEDSGAQSANPVLPDGYNPDNVTWSPRVISPPPSAEAATTLSQDEQDMQDFYAWWSSPTAISMVLLVATLVLSLIGLRVLRLRPLNTFAKMRNASVVFALPGIAAVSLYWCFNPAATNTQALLDLSVHPFASALGSVMPAWVIGVAVIVYRRMRMTERERIARTDPYKLAGEEVMSGKMNPGLWARSLVEANGNEEQARAIYIPRRVKELGDAA